MNLRAFVKWFERNEKGEMIETGPRVARMLRLLGIETIELRIEF